MCPGCGKGFKIEWATRKHPRKTCSDECFRKVQLSNLRSPQRQPLPATRVCSQCKKRKPLDADHFYRRKGYNFQHICKLCSAALQRDRYKTIPHEREMAAARARRQKERRKKRRAEDPAYDAECRRRERERNRRYYDKTHRTEPLAEVVEIERFAGPELPAPPLLEAIHTYAKRNGLTKEDAADHVGTNLRRINDWERKGGRAVVRESLADKILLALHLNWYEVWDPDEYPQVAKRLAA